MDSKENWPIAGINISVTKIIKLSKDEVAIGDATGFFFKDNSERKYLITNRHVVINELKLNFPQKLKIRIHSSHKDYHSNNEIIVNLYKNEKPLWLQHSRYNFLKVDVVAIPLNETSIDSDNLKLFNSSIINFFTKDNFIGNAEFSSFSNVLIVGYPLGFYDKKNNLPIYRKGMISSSYGVDFDNFPCFLIDANLHNGTSGSAVLSHPNNLLKNKMGAFHTNKSILLGIHSAERLCIDIEDNNEKKPLGLNCIWYSQNILEIISQK